MKFDFLAHHRDAIPIIGRWYHAEWGHRLRGETEEDSLTRLRPFLNVDRIPFILVATDRAKILGAAQLKYREMEDIFPEKEHWLGGVFVAPGYRGRGLGSQLVQEIARLAPSYGVHTLHLQTEQLDGGLYHRLGWQPVTQIEHRGVKVLVMERHIGA